MTIMEEVYRSAYQTFIFFAKEALLVEIWNNSSDDMTDEIYKQEFLSVNEVLLPYANRVDKVLIDARLFQYPMSPDLQVWHNENVFERMKVGNVTKNALVISNSTLAQISMEQTFAESAQKSNKELKLFNEIGKASKWLTNKVIDCRVTPYQIIWYNQANETLTQVWNIHSENIETNKLQQEFKDFADLARTYKPFKLLINALQLNHPILPNVQNWLNKEVFPEFLMAKLKYIALVISQNMHAQLSLDQTLEDIKTYNIETESFFEPAEAQKWLNP